MTVIAFSPPVVGCLLKKGFQKGDGGVVTGTPGAPLSYALDGNSNVSRTCVVRYLGPKKTVICSRFATIGHKRSQTCLVITVFKILFL